MEKQLFADHAPEQRKAFLQDNADSIELTSYTRKFTHEELAEFKDKLSTVAININSIAIEKKDVMDEFKDRMKPLNIEHSDLLEKIHNKAEVVEEDCFKMISHEEGMVGFYNQLGELVYSRPILPQEKQSTIFNINRKVQ
ncbi:hypothetical protein [Empedobacter sp.]|uniref:hypothetical protein n=1 Tax=Empedobacter sp. TaxID=1927715 RepID=UPI0028985988|nr:hypothetical protein [Empedobacter sp.]